MEVDKVRRKYHRTAWLYDRLIAAPTERLRREAVSHLRLRPGDRVLDLGCGMGSAFRFWSKRSGTAGWSMAWR